MTRTSLGQQIATVLRISAEADNKIAGAVRAAVLAEPKAKELADCDNLVKTIKAAMESHHPGLDIPTPPLPRHYALCTGLRVAVENLKQLPSLLRLMWNSPKQFGDQRGNVRLSDASNP